MNIISVKVPDHVNYVSDWMEFELPKGHSIINKTVCGCGFTQYCLTNDDDIILCSPRISLLENKDDQNPQCFYLESIKITPAIRKNILSKSPYGADEETVINDYIFNSQLEKISKYIQSRSQLSTQLLKSHPLKFMVTYDSLPLLTRILENLIGKDRLNKFLCVVDEFQLIFNDSHFKATTELDFLVYLQEYHNVVYLSATPMLSEYLEQLDEFKDLPYYKLDWGDRIIKPMVYRINTNNLEQSIIEIIKSYLDGNTESRINCNGDLVKSKEAVFYVNNVGIITSVLKKTNLSPENVNIIISKNLKNKQKLYTIGKRFRIGRAPLAGKPHKMFTFCTSTAYCGMDFYSTNAKTFVFSDCNLKTMALDISLDLPQIIGRQRLEENPFRYDVIFMYSTSLLNETRESFLKMIEKKEEDTNILVGVFNKSADKEKIVLRKNQIKVIDSYNYVDDYTGIEPKSGNLVLNKLVLLSDYRAWEIQQLNYKDEISVFRTIKEAGLDIINNSLNRAKKVAYSILTTNRFEDRMRIVCDEYELDPNTEIFNYIPEEFRLYINKLGVELIRSNYYVKSYLDKIVSNGDNSVENILRFENRLKKIVEVGDKLSLWEIKKRIMEILEELNITSINPKASLILDYFEVKPIQIFSTDKKKSNGYLILKVKGED